MAHALAAVVLWLCSALWSPVDAADLRKPTWNELSQTQRQVLAPLAADWERIDPAVRRKWIALADRYPKLKADEQQRLQKRMTDWAKLSPEQRDQARTRYRALSKLPPEKRSEIIRQWNESQEAQQALTADSPPAPSADAPVQSDAAGGDLKAAAPAQ